MVSAANSLASGAEKAFKALTSDLPKVKVDKVLGI
jgi:hypothetical protein